MSVFFDQIKKLESVNEFTLRDIDDPNVYKFNYKDLTLLAIQTSKNDNVLSRINFSLMCENLLNKVTKEKILEKKLIEINRIIDNKFLFYFIYFKKVSKVINRTRHFMN